MQGLEEQKVPRREEQRITETSLAAFEQAMWDNEKSPATVEKYLAALRKLMVWLDGREVSHAALIEYRDSLRTDHTAATVNGVICAVNSYLDMVGMPEERLKLQKVQKRVFRSEDRELTRSDYNKLLQTAKRQGKKQLLLIMETICSTGIRVSEVDYITLEAAEAGSAEVTLKGKTRTIFLPKKLARKLKEYARNKKIASGRIFLTRNGTPVSRKQIWAAMKALCRESGVQPSKVFPHNLRHLFARCFYKKTRDVIKLADMLGHSSVETTRIYLITTGTEHARALEDLGLVS